MGFACTQLRDCKHMQAASLRNVNNYLTADAAALILCELTLFPIDCCFPEKSAVILTHE